MSGIHQHHRLWLRVRGAVPLLSALLLAACGGGGSDVSDMPSGQSDARTAVVRATPASYTVGIWVNGKGSVTSSPAGISCTGTSHCSASFATGSSVTLTTTPATGQVVSAWRGPCAGTAASCTLAVTTTEYVSVSFEAGTSSTPPPPPPPTGCPTAPASVPNSPTPPTAPAGTVTAEPDLTQPWPPLPGLAPGCPAVPLVGSHATYNVGPGQQYTTLTAVPWLDLVAGDVVNIYYQSTPYATKFALRGTGTASAPIVINGVANASGQLPTITGNNAVTATDAIAQGYFTSSGGSIIEPFGVILVYRGLDDPFGYVPAHITIQNLLVTGAAPGNTYTDHTGTKQTYPQFTAGIYIEAGQYITVENDQVFGNGLGVFSNNQNGIAQSSFFITLRGNYIHDNGVVGSYTEHNVYVQGVRSLYEGNYITTLINGATGGSLKDRSSGPVVRYNYIVSAARAIDLVDSENGSTSTNSDPLYNMGWVYGNVIVNNFNIAGAGSGDLIHWGGDSTIYSQYHNGPLYFYDNTIYNIATSSQAYSLAMFDMPTSSQSIIASNNIIAMDGNANLNLCTNNANNGTIGSLTVVNKNWPAPYSVGSCTFTQSGTLLSGTPTLLSTYRLPAGSAAIGAGVAYPPSTMTLTSPASVTDLQVTQQFVLGTSTNATQPTLAARSTVTDLGAFPYP